MKNKLLITLSISLITILLAITSCDTGNPDDEFDAAGLANTLMGTDSEYLLSHGNT